MSRLTRRAVYRLAAVLIVLGVLMVLVTLTNSSPISMEMPILLIGIGMIAVASFAGL
jgi:hypothetical protein